MRKEFEELDLDAINHIMDYHEATMYGYSVGYGEEYVDEPFYQLIFENKLKREVFMEWENRVLNFIKSLIDKEEKILGIITTDQIKRHIMAKKSRDYYKDMLVLERAGKIGEKTIFNKEEAYIAAIIATRGIAEVYFLLEKSNAVICFWDLYGCIIFDSDKYIDDIVDCAQRYGINLEKTKKKYFETNEYQRLGSVVTNNGYSDWATTDISSSVKEMWYRLSRRESDYYIETSMDGINFIQMRAFHLFNGNGEISFGIYAASPVEASFTATFTNMEVSECKWEAWSGADTGFNQCD